MWGVKEGFRGRLCGGGGGDLDDARVPGPRCKVQRGVLGLPEARAQGAPAQVDDGVREGRPSALHAAVQGVAAVWRPHVHGLLLPAVEPSLELLAVLLFRPLHT